MRRPQAVLRVILGAAIALGLWPGPSSAQTGEAGSGPAASASATCPGDPSCPVEPRTLYQRCRVRMIGWSKSWIGLRSTREPEDGIRELLDVPYGAGPAQTVDLYLPHGQGFPVVVFVHGGAWVSEDKVYFGVFGRYLARNGVGAFLINYRLPPDANVEGEVQDVATAFAWTHRHAADYGGDPTRIYLSGHSAGSHLAAVVATNPAYLAATGLSLADIRGVVIFSGIYEIGLNMWILGVGYVFEGVDRKALSPVDMISSKLPPFLLVHAAREIFYLRRPTERFYRKLTEAGCAAELYVVPCANHYTQLLDIDKPGSPQGPRVLDFIRQH